MPIIEIERTFSPEEPHEVIERMGDRGRILHELEEVLNETARIGEQSMKIYEPKGKSGQLERHTSRERARPGVDADREARVGVKRMPTERDPRRGRYPDTGTGIYGPRGQYIYPTRGLGSPHSGVFMVFEIDGRKFVLPRVKGQKPQHFVRAAYHDIEAYLPARLELTARRIVEG